MWCIGKITQEYRERMYDLLDLYARPFNRREPVICLDEKSKQVLAPTRTAIALQPGRCRKEDYEYKRRGTRNLFVAVEPKGKHRFVQVTARRTKPDFVGFVQQLLSPRYARARRIHLVLDNLNTHFRKSFVEVLGRRAAQQFLRRVEFHYTPKHASWLNMAEIEIGILDDQCLDRRFDSAEDLAAEVAAWQARRNQEGRGINWTFTRQAADKKLSKHYL